MKWRDKFVKKITCPRCGLKSVEGVESCPDCGLVFSRLEVATNKDAKRKILRGDREYIIKTNRLPSDVSFLKLLLLCIFLGPVGAHCYYTGRYLRGGVLTCTFVAIIMFVIFNAPLMQINNGAFLGAVSTVCGLIELLWIWDIAMIILKKYKVPVAIDLEGSMSKAEKNKKREEFFKDTVLENQNESILAGDSLNQNEQDKQIDEKPLIEGTINAQKNVSQNEKDNLEDVKGKERKNKRK